MDLSMMSTADLQALQTGDMSKVSTQGLQYLAGQPQKPAQAAKPATMLDSIKQGVLDPVNGYAQILRHAVGDSAVGRAVDAAGNKLADWGLPIARTNGVTDFDQQAQQQEAAYQASRQAATPQNLSSLVTGKQAEPGFDWGRLVGNVVSPANVAVGRGLSTVGRNVTAFRSVLAGKELAPTMLGRIAGGAGAGAIFGASTPATDPSKDFADQKTGQMAWGALGGGAAPMIASGVSRLIQPKTGTDARALMDAGVQLTPGQILGGAFRRVEDAATSIPFIGDMIKGAQTNSVNTFNRAALNRVLEPIGEALPKSVPIGRDGVEYVATKLGDAYDSLVPRLSGRVDAPLMVDLQKLGGMAQQMPASQRDQFMAIVRAQVADRAGPNGTFTGETLKTIDSELGRLSRGYASDASMDVRNMGAALDQVRSAVRQMLARQNPALAPKLSAIDEGWANYTRLRNAASSVAAENGVFTPAQLQLAVKRGDTSVGKGNFAKGNALLQDLSDPARAVLPQKVPDSGTPFRSLLSLGFGAAAGHGLGLPAEALVGGGLLGGAASLAYTRPAQRIAQSLLASRPAAAEPLARGAEALLPYMISTSVPAIVGR